MGLRKIGHYLDYPALGLVEMDEIIEKMELPFLNKS